MTFLVCVCVCVYIYIYILCVCALLNDPACNSVCMASNALNRERRIGKDAVRSDRPLIWGTVSVFTGGTGNNNAKPQEWPVPAPKFPGTKHEFCLVDHVEQFVESGFYAKSNFSTPCFTSLVSYAWLKRLLFARFILQAISNYQVIWYTIRDPIRPGFPGTVRVLWVSKSSVSVTFRISSGTPNVPGYSKPKKYDISDNACGYCEFLTVGGKRL